MNGCKRFDCVTVLFSHECIAIDQSESNNNTVKVTIKNGTDEIQKEFRYVIGADGNRSNVRDLLGIEFKPVTPHEPQSIRIDVEGTTDTSLVMRSGNDFKRNWISFPAPNGRRFSFNVLPGEKPEDLLTDEMAYISFSL